MEAAGEGITAKVFDAEWDLAGHVRTVDDRDEAFGAGGFADALDREEQASVGGDGREGEHAGLGADLAEDGVDDFV